ncbi:uncharacterized protein Tco025E_00288 [Trypanosoma conorhini]|uniref:REH2 DRSM domain-containing protein n=1 Tax=Trypanosoma conorhini TaxID=83891 RepID=A0A422QC61_9TRYP|nr:uncharacterized protein Tco025E_00288 [Trypanosoma conorhini]RNF27486.1 hypothetical protein Tco025E_00288 [Trypanosoma conorhini]
MQRVRLLVGADRLLCTARRCLMGRSNTALSGHVPSPGSGGFVVREAIAPEMVTIELLPAAEEHCGHAGEGSDTSGGVGRAAANSHRRGGEASWRSGGGGTQVAGEHLRQKHYWDVTSIDNFAKSRVLNYVRRTGNRSADVFEVSAEPMLGRTVYRARCKLVLPSPHHFYVAEGVGEDEKDAELLAAMHAERVCDALGVPLFRLSSMQQKYAENVRRQGRYAPMPGDPIKPENTIAPPPLRMLTAAPEGSGAAAAAAAATDAAEASSFFSTTIAEAEIITDTSVTGKRRRCTSKLSLEQPPPAAAPTAPTAPVDATAANGTTTALDALQADGSGEPPYHATVHYPWHSPAAPGSHGGVAATGGGTTAAMGTAVPFDPTEGGMWQMVNANSTRCSPSQDALLLPCVYETTAYERLKDHFLHQGMTLKDRITISHVAVPGHSARMYVAELRLHDAIVARGKAQTKECAEHLAAMHAELLLDALARPLFPQDDARQARHATAVERFGRWAPNPITGDTQHPRPHDALPLPLKQQVGGDEVWLDPQMLRRYTYQRSLGERLIAAHNEINNYCGDYIESNPDPGLLAESRKALEAWQREVARNPHPDLFVITRMGEQFRASTLLPVPKVFGVRGGNAVGKTMEQSMDLCALHAVDTLCALGIPLFPDPSRQRAFLEQRRRMGLVTVEDMARLPSSKGLVAIPAPSLAAAASKAPSPERSARPPYLPGYMVEGNQPRPLPHIADTLCILHLRIPEDFDVYGEKLSDEAIIEAGNEAKVCVQNYLRHHLPRNSNVNASVYITGYGRQVSVHNIAYLPLVLPSAGRPAPEGATNAKKKKKSNNSAADAPEGGDNTKGGDATSSDSSSSAAAAAAAAATNGTNDEGNNSRSGCVAAVSQSREAEDTEDTVQKATERLLAVGISLKKKDAERMCYLHAVEILRGLGQDVLSNYRAGLPRRKQPPATPQPPTTSTPPRAGGGGATTAQDGGGGFARDKLQPDNATPEKPSTPRPYMHRLMKHFITSGRHYTPPKRRFQPGPNSPF